jgi:hypothetical protein
MSELYLPLFPPSLEPASKEEEELEEEGEPLLLPAPLVRARMPKAAGNFFNCLANVSVTNRFNSWCRGWRWRDEPFPFFDEDGCSSMLAWKGLSRSSEDRVCGGGVRIACGNKINKFRKNN